MAPLVHMEHTAISTKIWENETMSKSAYSTRAVREQ